MCVVVTGYITHIILQVQKVIYYSMYDLYDQVCILAHLYAEGDEGDQAVVLNHFRQFLIQAVELFEKGVGCQVIDQVGQV